MWSMLSQEFSSHREGKVVVVIMEVAAISVATLDIPPALKGRQVGGLFLNGFLSQWLWDD